MGSHKYFITFIDDYSHYGFFELTREKHDSLEAFKALKENVEFQQGKKIKVVHSDISGEYSGTYDETRGNPRPLMLNIQCLVLLNRMGLRRGGITHFLIWCNVCLLIPHYLSSCGINL